MTDIKRKNPGGRPKGVPNKTSWKVRMELADAGFNPIKEFIAAYRDIESPVDKVQSLLPLMRYIYPQIKDIDEATLRSLQDDDQDEHVSTRSTEELLALVADPK